MSGLQPDIDEGAAVAEEVDVPEKLACTVVKDIAGERHVGVIMTPDDRGLVLHPAELAPIVGEDERCTSNGEPFRRSDRSARVEGEELGPDWHQRKTSVGGCFAMA